MEIRRVFNKEVRVLELPRRKEGQEHKRQAKADLDLGKVLLSQEGLQLRG